MAKKRKQCREDSQRALLGAHFENEVYEHDGPRGKNQGFVEVGKRRMAVAQLVRLVPPQQNARGLNGQRETGHNAPGNQQRSIAEEHS